MVEPQPRAKGGHKQWVLLRALAAAVKTRLGKRSAEKTPGRVLSAGPRQQGAVLMFLGALALGRQGVGCAGRAAGSALKRFTVLARDCSTGAAGAAYLSHRAGGT